jgi:hypothetical protein
MGEREALLRIDVHLVARSGRAGQLLARAAELGQQLLGGGAGQRRARDVDDGHLVAVEDDPARRGLDLVKAGARSVLHATHDRLLALPEQRQGLIARQAGQDARLLDCRRQGQCAVPTGTGGGGEGGLTPAAGAGAGAGDAGAAAGVHAFTAASRTAKRLGQAF